MSNYFTPQKAIADIEFLKKTILNTSEQSPISAISIDTHVMLNIISFILAGSALLIDIFTGSITSDILASKNQPDLQIDGLVNIALFLIASLIGSYALIRGRAKKEHSPPHVFATHHFTYYRNFSILADIFIKFSLFAMIILAGKPEWISAILILFTGDLVIHGRHFYFPLHASMVLGAVCFITAAFIAIMNIPSLSIALGLFTTINLASLLNLGRMRYKIIKG